MIPLGPKPCLIKAIYEWIIDNRDIPHITIDIYYSGVDIPIDYRNYIDFGLAFVEISQEIIQNLVIDNEAISGQIDCTENLENLYIPIDAVLSIYGEKTQREITFFPEKKERKKKSKKSQFIIPVPSNNRVSKNQSRFRIIKGGKN